LTRDYITIDFETAKYSPESAVSVGLVKYRDFKPISSYYSLIRPPSLYIRPDFTQIHGLTVSDVKDAPDFKYLWENEIYGFIMGAVLAAHNAQFDMNVLRAALAWYKLPVPELSYFCTCSMARRAWPGLESYALTALGKNFGIVYNAHNALDDALTAGKLVQLAAEKLHAGKNLDKFIETSGINLYYLNREEDEK
jgi:DNA polymerase-3 subunit epsilon